MCSSLFVVGGCRLIVCGCNETVSKCNKFSMVFCLEAFLVWLQVLILGLLRFLGYFVIYRCFYIYT